MSDLKTKCIIEQIIGKIDIPDSSYELAKKRYKDLADWFARPEARCSKFNPYIYPQGSFRLGTVIRPLDENGEYDLDVGCRMCTGMTKATHSQKQLKHLIGDDLEDYRIARNIKESREEKHRCWRLKYADTLSFHMDAVPSIPEITSQRRMIKEAIMAAGSAEVLAASVTEHAGCITDNRDPRYDVIYNDWRISNSEGYAIWFESRMELSNNLLEKWAIEARVAKIDKLLLFKRRSPLQQCIQILKRHRDVMFKDNSNGKPISMIITTLAAEAYQGQDDIDDALSHILTEMSNHVNLTKPRVANPVNPAEDFADKWYDPKYRHLNLEQSFYTWLEQANADIRIIGSSNNLRLIDEQINKKFGISVNADDLREKLGFGISNIDVSPKKHVIPDSPVKPWRSA